MVTVFIQILQPLTNKHLLDDVTMTSLRLRAARSRRCLCVSGRRSAGGVRRRYTGGARDYLHGHRLQDAHHPAVSLAGQRATRSREIAAQEAVESVAEVARTESVDERIDGRVAVAEPEEDVEHHLRGTVTTERSSQVHGEEWSPAHDETPDDCPL